MHRLILTSVLSLAALHAQEFTRGVGVYPGDPKQNWSPTLQPASEEYRNLALHRPAYHSSSYDFNLTAQLITDGVKETVMPRRIAVSTSQQALLKKNERDRILDNNWTTSADLRGKSVWVQIEIAGGADAPAIDSLLLDGSVRATEPENQQVTVTVSGSGDGKEWKELGQAGHAVRPAGELHFTIPFSAPSRSRFYRVQSDSGRLLQWQIGELTFLHRNEQVHLGGPYDFSSAWMSAGSGEEWVYVDLGVKSRFDRVALAWIRRAAEGAVQVSDDAANWKTVHALDSGDIKLSPPAEARYVRVLMTKAAAPEGYVLSELEVWGHGGLSVRPKPAAPGLALSGGAWKVQRDALVKASGAVLSQPGFVDRDWLVATVPGTVLASYLNAGAVPDPDFGENQAMISDSFFYADFWYRNEFLPPAAGPDGKVWLNFAGINWKADVYLNGEKLGRIEGAFTRARFDVTGKMPAGRKSALAVRILKNATPGSITQKTLQSPGKNGGALGADNPTFHAAVGWDWIPTVRGRDTGIWNDVFFTVTGGVTIENPFVDAKLPLPDTSHADITIQATLRNHQARPVTGTLRGRFGDHAFTVPVSLDAGGSKTVKQLITVENPKLWWPNGYGEANLYDVELKFENSDTKQFQAGIRQFTYSEEGGALRFFINGRRFIGFGGNWGFSESMLRYRGREYEAAMRYHRDQHFNMVRNWVGQVGEDAFYEAADRNGIVIMQDFWLANPWDGPDPTDNAMFMRNVSDTLLRIRNHPSIGLYCGRNEGYPLKPLDDAIRAAIRELHPGIHYVPSSADDTVTGHGPYQAMPPDYYFTSRAPTKFHSELGMPNIVTIESLKAMMPEASLWPQGEAWGVHDFSLGGAQGGASFRNRIDTSYGGADNAADWVTLAQFVNYEGYRAMFEAQSKNRMGLLLWMSHPAWPTMVWQTYDYYLEPTAAYFGAKHACEPLHIQWNPTTDRVEVVNYSAGNAPGLALAAEIINLDGSVPWRATVTPLDSQEDSVISSVKLEFPASVSAVHFIRLKLTRGGETLSENFYWRGVEKGNYRALRQLPKVKLEVATHAEKQGGRWLLMTELKNPSAQPALMVRLKAVRETTGDRILPALYSDNYIALMPGEARTIRTELENADTRGERPTVVVEGFNVQP
jgi:hypothetical protein